MKKYRHTRITVKTREIVSFPNKTASDTADNLGHSVCPLCHSPILTAPLPQAAALLTTDYDEAAQHDCPRQ